MPGSIPGSPARPCAPASQIFAPDALAGRVVLVTGGGTNLGKQAAIELAAAGARGRHRRAPRGGPRRGGRARSASAARPSPATSASPPTRRGSSRPRRRAPRAPRRARQQRRRPVLRARRGDRGEGLARRPAPERRRHLHDDPRRGRRRLRRATAGPSSTSPSRPHHGMPAMAHTGAARAAVEALTRELAAEWARAPHRRRRRRHRALRHRVAAQVPRGRLARAPRAASRCSASGRCRSSAGSSRCSPARSAARSAARSSPSTARADNWFGPWPPPTLTDDAGAVPTERAAAPHRPADLRYALAGLAGEVLWLHRSLPSF